MPLNPYLVYGTVKNSHGLILKNIKIDFSNGTNLDSVFTNVEGKYVFDLAEIEYTSSDTITYSAVDEFNNEFDEGNFTITGQNKLLDFLLEHRTDAIVTPNNRGIQLYNVGGKPISNHNPLPVSEITNELITYTNDFSAGVTGATIITPPPGKRIEAHSIFANTSDAVNDVTIACGSKIWFKLYVAKTNASASTILHLTGNIDEPINITCPANTFVSFSYHVVE